MSQDDEAARRLLGFFTRPGRSQVCPFCRTTDWAYASNVGAFAFTDDRQRLAESDCYALLCRTCGFVRVHLKEQLDVSMAADEAASPGAATQGTVAKVGDV